MLEIYFAERCALKKEGERQDFDIVRTASLTLLGLIIGFSFASLFLIADIDSPRTGIIRVQPHNLIAQCLSMQLN